MTAAIVILGFIYPLIASGRILNSVIAINGAMAWIKLGVITDEEAH